MWKKPNWIPVHHMFPLSRYFFAFIFFFTSHPVPQGCLHGGGEKYVFQFLTFSPKKILYSISHFPLSLQEIDQTKYEMKIYFFRLTGDLWSVGNTHTADSIVASPRNFSRAPSSMAANRQIEIKSILFHFGKIAKNTSWVHSCPTCWTNRRCSEDKDRDRCCWSRS